MRRCFGCEVLEVSGLGVGDGFFDRICDSGSTRGFGIVRMIRIEYKPLKYTCMVQELIYRSRDFLLGLRK